jgi:recombination protein RecR
VTQAWGDGILHGLSARGKALYSVGRFVDVENAEVQFALPNAAHRDKCMQLSSEVEAALSAHFATPIRLVLVVDAGTGAPPPVEAARPSEVRHEPPSDAEGSFHDEDPEVLQMAPSPEDHQASAVDRLLEAFPGASEVGE